MKTKDTSRRIGTLGGEDGGLYIKADDSACFWAFSDGWKQLVWEEIPEGLYHALNQYQDKMDADLKDGKNNLGQCEHDGCKRKAVRRDTKYGWNLCGKHFIDKL